MEEQRRRFSVVLNNQELEQIKAPLREEIKASLEWDEIVKRLQDPDLTAMLSILRQCGIYDRYEKLADRSVKSLSDGEKMVCLLQWVMYERLY